MIFHRIEIKAPPEVVFAHYQNVPTWPLWDSETSAVALANLHVGTEGWLKPRQGPKAAIRVAQCEPNHSFTIESQLPLCRMQFGHELHTSNTNADCTTATHWVRFSGPLAFVFRRLIGRSIDKTLPATLAGLKRASEQALLAL